MKKRNLYKLFIFTGLLLGALKLTSSAIHWSLKQYDHDAMNKISSVINHQLDAEITIWGASTAWVHVNPKTIEDSLHQSAYNVGLDGTAFDQYRGLFNTFIQYTQSSKAVIICLDISSFEKRNAIYLAQNWLAHLDNPAVYEALHGIDPTFAWRLRWVPFYDLIAYDKQTFTSIWRGFNDKAHNHASDYKGFHPRNDDWEQHAIPRDSIQINISDTILTQLHESLAQCINKGIKVILVLTPCFDAAKQQIKNPAILLEKTNQLCEQLDPTHRMVAVLDYFNHPIGRDQSLFYNFTHLNEKGAIIFTQYMVSDLRKAIDIQQLN